MGKPLKDSRCNLLVEVTVTMGYLHELASAFSKEEKRPKSELTTGKYFYQIRTRAKKWKSIALHEAKKEQFEKRNISKEDTKINRSHYKTGGKPVSEMVGAFPIRSNN